MVNAKTVLYEGQRTLSLPWLILTSFFQTNVGIKPFPPNNELRLASKWAQFSRGAIFQGIANLPSEFSEILLSFDFEETGKGMVVVDVMNVEETDKSHKNPNFMTGSLDPRG
jgi:hypothetical protein